MNRYSYSRRQADNPRWRVNNPAGECIALCETENAAIELKNSLNELLELRLLLAVAGKTLAVSQACAILGCNQEQLERKTSTCLQRGYE